MSPQNTPTIALSRVVSRRFSQYLSGLGAHFIPAQNPRETKLATIRVIQTLEFAMIRLFAALLLLGISCVVAVQSVFGQQPKEAKPAVRKKVIEWGWDEPDTKFMRENIAKMEEAPFDGVVFHAMSGSGVNLSWEVWGNRKFEIAEFKQAIEDLRGTKFQRFTDRFLRVNITPAHIDWFDDAAWANVANNFGVAAHVAKKGRCKGFMFDTEQYEGVTEFDYREQKDKAKRSFADYQAKVRQRGREWMKAVNAQNPSPVILLAFGYDICLWNAARPKDRSTAAYGLLPDFLDGMIEVATKETVIVDAWEFSYPYKERKQFDAAYETITKTAADYSAVPEKYREKMKAGFGIWIDHKRKGWDLADFSKNHFSPAEFESSVRSALEVSDEYVWIYSERPKWWTREMLPPAYAEALVKARGAEK